MARGGAPRRMPLRWSTSVSSPLPSAGRWQRPTDGSCTATTRVVSPTNRASSGPRDTTRDLPGTRTRGTPASARSSSPGIQPSGATLNGPSRRSRQPARPRWRGRRDGRTARADHQGRRGEPPRPCAAHGRASLVHPRPPGSRAGGSRTCVPGWSDFHSTANRSRSAARTANSRSVLGRSGASSVSGTGFVGHAPYTVALESNTTVEAPMPAAASSNALVSSTPPPSWITADRRPVTP